MSPIERAARALFDEAATQDPGNASCFGYAAADDGKTILDGAYDLKAMARAVLQAIREPSEGMLGAGWHETIPLWEGGASDLQDVWRAMIDAALTE